MELLEEIDGLVAFIEANPQFPYAHLAHHQAAVAKHAVETALVDTGDVSTIFSLEILRTIAETTTRIPSNTIIHNGGLLWLMLETGDTFDANRTFLDACRYNYEHIVRLILNCIIDISALKNGLWWACKNGHKDIVILLLETKSEVYSPIIRNNSFLQACYHGHVHIVRLFLESERNLAVNDALNDACRMGQMDIVRLLLDMTSIGIRNQAFFNACYYGHTEIVRMILPRCDPAANNNVAFRLACRYGRIDIVLLLLDLKRDNGDYIVNPAELDNDALRSASDNGHSEVVRMLLNLPPERGVKPQSTSVFR